MADRNNLNNIIERILNGSQTKDDIDALLRLLNNAASDREVISQLGKYNVYIGEGQDIHIGDRTYYTWNDEALRALVRMIRFGESIEPKIREKQDYYQNEIREINNQRKKELYQLNTKYQDDLRNLKTDFNNNLNKITIEYRSNRRQEISVIIAILITKKNELMKQLEKARYYGEYISDYMKFRREYEELERARYYGEYISDDRKFRREYEEIRCKIEEIENKIEKIENKIDFLKQSQAISLHEVFSQSRAIFRRHDPEIPVDADYRQQAINLRENLDYNQQELKSALIRDEIRIKFKAENDIQTTEKKGREETYRLVIQFYLNLENYPFSSSTLNKLKQFQQELKMGKDEIEAVEKSEITTKSFYQKNVNKYKEEFTQRINQEGYPLSSISNAELKKLQESLGLRNPDIMSVEESIIESFYEKNLNKYKEYFERLMNKDFNDLTEESIANLRNQKDRLGLKSEDVKAIEQEIIKKYYQTSLDKYEEEFTKLINKEGYPLNIEIIATLKQRQELLGLRNPDIMSVEESIIKDFYQDNMNKYKKYFERLMNKDFNDLTEKSIANLRNQKDWLGLKSEDVKAIEQEIIKKYYQTSLDKYEEEFTKLINKEGYPLNIKIIATLKQRQEFLGVKLLGFNREDIVIVKQIINTSKEKSKAIDYLSSDAFEKDYQKLQNLLASKQWKEANEETKNILYTFILAINEMPMQPMVMIEFRWQIRIIDILWDVYSKGRFGFHKQRDIFVSSDRQYKTFSENIGWKKRVCFFSLDYSVFPPDFSGWKSKEEIMFSIDAPEGHLPFWRDYMNDREHIFINLIDSEFN